MNHGAIYNVTKRAYVVLVLKCQLYGCMYVTIIQRIIFAATINTLIGQQIIVMQNVLINIASKIKCVCRFPYSNHINTFRVGYSVSHVFFVKLYYSF